MPTVPLLCLLLWGCAGTLLQRDRLENSLAGRTRLRHQIEARGITIENPDGLASVAYLARAVPSQMEVHVGYFLIWPDESPDFGTTYPVDRATLARQALVPLIYTRWLYLPHSGGLQRLLYGRGDVEGVFAVYAVAGDSLGGLKSLTFERPGHREFRVAEGGSDPGIGAVSLRGAPFLRVASWNHLFGVPTGAGEAVHFHVKPFTAEQWERLNMDRRRAEIAKRHLQPAGPAP